MNNKNSLNKGILALAAVLLVSFSVSEAFSYGHGGRKHGNKYHRGCFQDGHYGFRHLERLKVDLNLSEKQVEKIFKIGTKYRELYFKNRTDSEKLDKLKADHRKEIENVLNDDQKEKFNNQKRGYWGNGKYKKCPYRK